MNVLVTGAFGYIGSVLVPRLQAAGHTVLGYDTGWFGTKTEARYSVVGDIRTPLVHPAWPDVVVHMAGLSNDPMGDLSPALTTEINYWGTIDFASRYPQARHVVVSSCAVYGQADHLCDETSPTNPQTTYARCKAQVDDWMHGPAHSGFERGVISLRLGTVYGPSPNHRLDLVVNRMVYDAVTYGRVRATGDAARPLVHIDDVADAIRWAVEGDATGVYNVVGENEHMNRLATIVGVTTGAKVTHLPGGPDTRDYMASGGKLALAGWHPKRTLAAALPELITRTPYHPYDDAHLTYHVRLDQLRRRIDSDGLDPKSLRFAA